MKDYIKDIRKRLNLERTEFANLLNMGRSGDSIVRDWELGEYQPTKRKLNEMGMLEKKLIEQHKIAPYAQNGSKHKKFTFIDLFAGIGGLRLPFQQLGGKCVFSSEWDKFAQRTYAANFGEIPKGDITQIQTDTIPDHDLLLAGFPCQAFSQAGLKQGFNDTRGTMFFEIQRILVGKRPKMFLLENVKQLRGHDKGNTLKTMLAILRGTSKQNIPKDIAISSNTRRALSKKLNYWVDCRVLRAVDYGSPQNRERIFIVGFNYDYYGKNTNFDEIFKWPTPSKKRTCVADILEDLTGLSQDEDKFTISDKLWAGHRKRKAEHRNKGNGFGYSLFNKGSEYTNTLSARYYKDGSEILIDQSELGKNPRKLTPRECANLQGFPKDYIVDAVSNVQMYKQFGNSVCLNVIKPLAESILNSIKCLSKGENKSK